MWNMKHWMFSLVPMWTDWHVVTVWWCFLSLRWKGVHVSCAWPEGARGRLPSLWQRHHPRPHHLPYQRWPSQHSPQVPHQHLAQRRLSSLPYQQRGGGGAGGRGCEAGGVHAVSFRPGLQRWLHPLSDCLQPAGGAAGQEDLHPPDRWGKEKENEYKQFLLTWSEKRWTTTEVRNHKHKHVCRLKISN